MSVLGTRSPDAEGDALAPRPWVARFVTAAVLAIVVVGAAALGGALRSAASTPSPATGAEPTPPVSSRSLSEPFPSLRPVLFPLGWDVTAPGYDLGMPTPGAVDASYNLTRSTDPAVRSRITVSAGWASVVCADVVPEQCVSRTLVWPSSDALSWPKGGSRPWPDGSVTSLRRYGDVVVALAIEPAHRGKATWPDSASPTAVLTPEQAEELMDLIGIPPVPPLPSASG